MDSQERARVRRVYIANSIGVLLILLVLAGAAADGNGTLPELGTRFGTYVRVPIMIGALISSGAIIPGFIKSILLKFRFPHLARCFLRIFGPFSYFVAAFLLTLSVHDWRLWAGFGAFVALASLLIAWPFAWMTKLDEAAAPNLARDLVSSYVQHLHAIAETFEFGHYDRWYGDFAVGFIDGHIVQAFLRADEHDALQWQHYEWESEGRNLFVSSVSETLRLPKDRVAEAFDRAKKDPQNPDGPYTAGMAVALSILLRVEGRGATAKDLDARRIDDIVRSYARLPGRPWFRRPGLYEYLVVKTLGEDVFGVQLSDETLAEMLGIGRRATPSR